MPEPDAEELIEELVEVRLAEASGAGGQQPGRYGMHSLLRLFARERCRAEEPAPERTRAARRMVGGWLHLAEQAQTRLPGGRPRIGVRGGLRWSVPTDVTAAAVADPEAWFETERLALAGAVRTACSFGLDELAWDLAVCLGRFLEVRG
ncbi:MAG: hypothetical protein ACM30G_23135 [Micromonosporaceae bacterium]